MSNKITISKARVDKIPLTESGQSLYWDAKLPGFGLRVGRVQKTYIVQKKIRSKTVRFSIGSHGQITPEQARKEAIRRLADMTRGKNPVDQKRQAIATSITLEEVFNAFMKTRGENLTPKTAYLYESIMNTCFADWLKKEITGISKDMISRRHAKIGSERGKAHANGSMRVLRAVFNYAMGEYEDSRGESLIHENPVRRLSQTRAWFKISRRDDYIKANELRAFFDAVESLESDIVRDYLLVLLFTGLRRNEAAQLKWSDVDFSAKTIKITDTKNREPLNLPLSDYLYDLLRRRSETVSGDYVFPGNGAAGHIIEPKRQFKKIREAVNHKITLHGLRRTFITIADSIDLPLYAIKRLVNHKMSGDVTAGYIVSDVERLREPARKIADFILLKAGRKEAAKVIQLRM